MSALDLLEFRGSDYKLEEFVDAFRSHLPVIMVATTGIDPDDDPLHSISAEDMFWIYALKHQTRVLASDESSGNSTSKYFSIPLDYPHKFQTVSTPLNCTRGGSQHSMRRHHEKEPKVVLGQPMSLKDLVAEKKRSPGGAGAGGQFLFTFQNTEEVRIIREGSTDRRRKISTLKYVIEYDQRYLVGHSIVQSEMIPQTTMIPVYLDLSVNVANGIRGQDETTFKQWLEGVNEVGFKLAKSTGQASQAIIEFKDIPDCCDYEYIRPYSYLKTDAKPDDDDETSARGNAHDGGKNYEEIEARLPPPAIPPRNRSPNVRLPPIPTAFHKKCPPSSDRPIARPRKPSLPLPENAIDARTSEAKAARLSVGAVNQASVADDSDDEDDDYETIEIDEEVADKSDYKLKRDSMRESVTVAATLLKDEDYEIFETATSANDRKSLSVGTKLTSYRHLAEVPVDIRVSELSVDEVAHSLALLGLSSHADTVRARLIDGAIVADALVDDNLLRSAGFSDFEAMQFKKFLNGWRPRI